MKQLICEVCGSNDFIKTNGMFVCNQCKTKYAADEMQSAFGAYSEAIKAEENRKIENLISTGLEELDAGNFADAFDVFKSVLFLDAGNSVATFYKSLASAYKSVSDGNIHFMEVADAANRALAKNLKENNEGEAYYKFVVEVLTRLQGLAFLEINAKYYATEVIVKEGVRKYNQAYNDWMDARVAHSSLQLTDSYRSDMNRLAKTVSQVESENENAALSVLNAACDFMMKILKSVQDVMLLPPEIPEKIKNCLSNYEQLMNMKVAHLRIGYQKAEVGAWDSETMKSAAPKIESVRRACADIEKQRKTLELKKYWEEHPEEQKALEDKKADFNAQIAEAQKSIKTTVAEFESARRPIMEALDMLSDQLSHTGFFKFKEKKALKKQIEEKEFELQASMDKQKNAVEAIESKIKTFRQRIAEIDSKFKVQ